MHLRLSAIMVVNLKGQVLHFWFDLFLAFLLYLFAGFPKDFCTSASHCPVHYLQLEHGEVLQCHIQWHPSTKNRSLSMEKAFLQRNLNLLEKMVWQTNQLLLIFPMYYLPLPVLKSITSPPRCFLLLLF